MADIKENPNLIPKKNMAAIASTGSKMRPLVSEIFTKVNNAKDKPKKIAVLQEYDSQNLRMLIKGAFDPNVMWDLPDGTPPYKRNDAPTGTEHTYLLDEAKKLWHFVKGGNPGLSKTRKESMFIQLLENLHGDESEVMINIKDKKLNQVYKGLTANLVKEAFGWNDNFNKN